MAVASGALLCAVGVALPAGAGISAEQTVNVSTTGLNAERIKTLPIAKKSGRKRRVAMSLGPGKVGNIGTGDAVWAGGELEVSVTCLEPMPQCIGRLYRFSPQLKAKVVLANGPKATGDKNTFAISNVKRQRCSQELPNRNHHCVIALDGIRQVDDASKLPCDRCYVNFVVEAYHRKAKRGNVVVVGTDQDNGQIAQDKGTLNAAVFDPGPRPAVDPDVTTQPSKRRIPVAAQNSSSRKSVVIYSHRLNELRAGEQLLIDARAKVKTGHLGYGALLQSQLIVSEKPNSDSRAGIPNKILSSKGIINAQNGFNCTKGRSGHASPCTIRKLAAVRIFRDARTRPLAGEGPFVPLFVNLVVSSKAEFGGERHDPGDAAKVRGGAVSVTRFGPEFRP
jgi:hypothetical protein